MHFKWFGSANKTCSSCKALLTGSSTSPLCATCLAGLAEDEDEQTPEGPEEEASNDKNFALAVPLLPVTLAPPATTAAAAATGAIVAKTGSVAGSKVDSDKQPKQKKARTKEPATDSTMNLLAEGVGENLVRFSTSSSISSSSSASVEKATSRSSKHTLDAEMPLEVDQEEIEETETPALTTIGGAVDIAIPAAPYSRIQPHQKEALNEWLYEHPDTLYPTREQKNDLILSENLTNRQIEGWFASNRDKILKEQGELAPPPVSASVIAVPAAPFPHIQPHQVIALEQWLDEHPDSCRPTRAEKNSLIVSENVTDQQLKNWFNHNRIKVVKELLPMAPKPSSVVAIPAEPYSSIQPHQQAVLKEWLQAHPDALRPTRPQKNALIMSENLTNQQLENWFAGNRARLRAAAKASASSSSSSSSETDAVANNSVESVLPSPKPQSRKRKAPVKRGMALNDAEE